MAGKKEHKIETDEQGNPLEPIVPIVLATGVVEFPGYFRYIQGDKVLAVPRHRDNYTKSKVRKAPTKVARCAEDMKIDRHLERLYLERLKSG